jgi:hypothetical protein
LAILADALHRMVGVLSGIVSRISQKVEPPAPSPMTRAGKGIEIPHGNGLEDVG